VSGPDGRFTIPDVKIGTDYRVVVYPGKAYRDYAQQPVAVAEGTFLDVTLESLDAGSVTGRMVDAEGTPIRGSVCGCRARMRGHRWFKCRATTADSLR